MLMCEDDQFYNVITQFPDFLGQRFSGLSLACVNQEDAVPANAGYQINREIVISGR